METLENPDMDWKRYKTSLVLHYLAWPVLLLGLLLALLAVSLPQDFLQLGEGWSGYVFTLSALAIPCIPSLLILWGMLGVAFDLIGDLIGGGGELSAAAVDAIVTGKQ